MTLWPDGKIDFNVGNWNCQKGMIRFEGESWDGSSGNVDDPVLKLYRPTGADATCPSPESFAWWIQNAGSAGGDNVGSLQFRALPTYGILGSETVSTMQTRVTFQRNGNVGINTTTPIAKLQVRDGAVMFDGTTGSTPTSGAGTRLMWIPEKYSLRAGEATGSEWDNSNIGDHSIGFGKDVKVSGRSSISSGEHLITSGVCAGGMGAYDTVAGNHSFAFGYGNKIESNFSFASGSLNTILYDGSYGDTRYSVAMGESNVVSDLGKHALAVGYVDTVTVEFAIAMGWGCFSGNVADGSHCGTAIGHACKADGTDAVAMGLANTAALYSSAIGNNDSIMGPYSGGFGSYLKESSSYTQNILLGTGYSNDHKLTASGATRVEIGAYAVTPTATVMAHPNKPGFNRWDLMGFVGIGENNPNNRLEVNGGVVIGSSSYTGGEISIEDFSRQKNRLIVEEAVEIGAMDYYDYTVTPATVMNRDYALYVHGDYYIDGSNWFTSDSSLKQNITPYRQGLDAIRKVRPVTYVWKCDTCSGQQMTEVGVIAQELHEVLPMATRVDSWKSMFRTELGHTETVASEVDSVGHQEFLANSYPPKYESKSKNRWAIRPSDITYTLVNAVQELDSAHERTALRLNSIVKRSDSLQVIVGSQQQSIDSLRAMVSQLFALVASGAESTGSDNMAWLMQNVPNPVSTTTEISCWVSDQQVDDVVLKVTNLQNMKVYFATPISKGSTQVIALDRSTFDAGPYMYCLETSGKVILCKKMFVNP